MTQRRHLTKWALTMALGIIGLLFAVPGANAAPQSEPELVTEIIDVTPVVGPGDEIEVTVSVENRGEEPILDGALELRFRSAQLISRSSVEMWQEPEEGPDFDQLRSAGAVVTRTTLAELKPGASRTETLRISADTLYLPRLASQWGPRGIGVDTKIGDEIVQRDRTFILWFPADADQIFPSQVSVLAPLTGTPPGGTDGEAAGERILKVLAATDSVETSYALDPYLLTGSETAVTPAQLRDALEGQEIFALPQFDADVSALAHVGDIGAEDYLSGARSTINSTLETSASDVLLWPDGRADLTLASFAARYESAGAGAIITSPNQLTPVAPLTYTPSGKARVVTDSGVVTALIPDPALSATLTAAATEGASSSLALARQRLLADMAVITQERPADPRHVLITVPRNWNPDAERSTELLTSLADAPWVEFEAVRTLIGAPSAEFDREPLPQSAPSAEQIAPELVQQAQQASAQVARFRTIVEQPDLVAPESDAQLAGIVSNAWRQAPESRTELVNDIALQAQQLGSSVEVIPAGTVNLVTDAGEIPVLIHNAFDQAATVRVRLHTDSSFLKTSQPVKAELPPNSETSVLLPVEAIGNRDVEVSVHLETNGGEQIGAPQTITVRVRAGWEDAGTRVAGVVLVVLFVIGIIRTIKRARKRAKS